MASNLETTFGDPGSKALFPNICSLVSGPQKQAIVDVVEFLPQGSPVFHKSLATAKLPSALADSATATLFIVENVNTEFIDFFREHCQQSGGGVFDLQCLETFLDAAPIYVYTDIEPQLPVAQSLVGAQQHLNLQSVSAREFERHFPLEEESLDNKKYWPNGKIGGVLYPIQRKDKVASCAPFPPVVIVEQKFTAWFDAREGEAWRTGLILVDAPFQGKSFPTFKQLKLTPSAATPIYTQRSNRLNLTACMEQNAAALSTAGVPTPFLVLQDTYRVVVSEWMATVTYFARDLNTIQWSLEGRTGNNWATPEEFEEVLRRLYTIRRRLKRYQMLVGQQLASCAKCGQATWNPSPASPPPSPAAASPVVAKASADLQLDFGQTLDLIERNLDLAEHSIRLLTSLMSILHGRIGIEENKRNIAQNKILMMLTFVATFFLPINAISAILNMQGDWAPLQPNFGTFWAITIPISTVLVILLLVFRFIQPLASLMSAFRKSHRGCAKSAPGAVSV